MRDSLQRLYETKLVLLATSLTLAGLALILLGHWAARDAHLGWLSALPVGDIGSTLFTTGLLVVALNYLDSRDSEDRAARRLRRILAEQAPAMRDAVIAGFAFDADDLARVSSPEVLDRITRNALAIQLGDTEFADEVYEDIRSQAIRAGERWYDLETSIDLSTWAGDGPHADTPLFVVTVNREYTVTPSSNVRRFVCVSDAEEYRELAQEHAATQAWHFQPVAGLKADDRKAFELVQFSVDGSPRPIRRTERAGSQTYTVSLGKQATEAGRPVRISYAYRTVVRQHGHLFRMAIGQPTKGVKIQLRYGDCGIAKVNVLDFIASSQRTLVTQSPDAWPEPYVMVEFDGWAFPRSGVAFVWTLDTRRRFPVGSTRLPGAARTDEHVRRA